MSFSCKKYLKLSIVVVAALLVACNSNVFYFEKNTINGSDWDINDKFVYDVDITDTLRLYNFHINIRNTNEYSKRNIFFFVKTTFPTGAIAVDTVECLLADPAGRWTGKGYGRLYDNMFLFRENVIFPMKGGYEFEISHGMRDTVVKGVSEIGLRIDYSH